MHIYVQLVCVSLCKYILSWPCLFNMYNAERRKNTEAFFTLDLFICKLIKLNKYSFINFNMYFLADIRKAEHVKGRSINLALSTRGRTALRMVGLEDTVLENGIPMHARMIHDPDGSRRPILYGKEDQVRINKILLYHCKVQTKFGKYGNFEKMNWIC